MPTNEWRLMGPVGSVGRACDLSAGLNHRPDQIAGLRLPMCQNPPRRGNCYTMLYQLKVLVIFFVSLCPSVRPSLPPSLSPCLPSFPSFLPSLLAGWLACSLARPLGFREPLVVVARHCVVPNTWLMSWDHAACGKRALIITNWLLCRFPPPNTAALAFPLQTHRPAKPPTTPSPGFVLSGPTAARLPHPADMPHTTFQTWKWRASGQVQEAQ